MCDIMLPMAIIIGSMSASLSSGGSMFITLCTRASLGLSVLVGKYVVVAVVRRVALVVVSVVVLAMLLYLK